MTSYGFSAILIDDIICIILDKLHEERPMDKSFWYKKTTSFRPGSALLFDF